MKGRLYRCAVCMKEDDRGRMVKHVLTEHIPLERVPYRCGVCNFRETEKPKWQKHLKLKNHQKALEMRGVKEGPCLIESKNPWKLVFTMDPEEEADIYEMGSEASKVAWSEKNKKNAKEDKENVQGVNEENTQHKEKSKGTSQKENRGMLEKLKKELKEGKDHGEILRELQLLLWTNKDSEELKAAENSIEPKSEKSAPQEKVVAEGQFDDAESENESSSDESESSESEAGSIEEVEDLFEQSAHKTNRTQELESLKGTIIIEADKPKKSMKRKRDDYELSAPSEVTEVIQIDLEDEPKVIPAVVPSNKVVTPSSKLHKSPGCKPKGNDTRGKTAQVKRRKIESKDKDDSEERSHQWEKVKKRPREDDEVEGERAPKRRKEDTHSSTPVVKDEEKFGCIELDQQCDDLDNDLVQLNAHQDCVKAITPAVGKVVRECITAVSSAITAKVANQPLPLGAVMQGVSSELVVVNQSLSSLVGKMNDLCLEKSEHRGVGVELRSIARNIDTMRTDVCHSAGAHERAAGDMARSLREFNNSTIQIKTALQSLTNQLSSHNDLLCKVLQDQTKEFRRLSNTIGGLQEDLRQGGTTCNLTRQILGIPKKEVPENKLEESRKSPKPSTSSYETYYTRKGRERYSGTHHYKYNHPY